MVNEQLIWAIFFLPLASFALIALVIRPFFNHASVISGPIAVVSIGASFVISILTFIESTINGEPILVGDPINWLTIGAFKLEVGILLDPLTTTMLVVVTGVSLMVQIYSTFYMKDPGSHQGTENQGNDSEPAELGQPVYARYFAYMSLFTASMLGLVMASNVVQLFVFWELVGLCSYLLIGFWFHRPAAAAAAKKAFIVTRVGDFGFLLALMYLFSKTYQENINYLNIQTINENLPALVSSGTLGAGALTLIAIGFFVGAIGKSGQFPLHTWLPDAMEGPTPVSALIHAATMVTAGVFLVGRFFPLFQASQDAMMLVALVGGITALFAATMGLVSNDIKRVLAYSTVSQLGYMMLALGIGAYGVAIFHLFTHAFFKALLFLGSGSVNHATGTFDMRFMGGLRKKMPITYITFLIGSLSLAGIFPLAGFWSKDEILLNSFKSGTEGGELVSMIVFVLAIIAVFMTAFYMFRALFMTFEGEFRGGSEKDPEANPHGPVHLAESPLLMVIPMVILAIPAVLIGILANPPLEFLGIEAHWMVHTLDHMYHIPAGEGFDVSLAAVSTLVALAGIVLAIAMYKPKPLISPESIGKTLRPVHTLLYRKYYFDELYEGIFVRQIYYRGLALASDWTDRNIVDRAVNIVGWTGANFGGLIRQFQNGQMQMYATVTSIGIIVITAIFIFGD
ncbi:MAG: NADH-quinone oxidoreductase subunit L [Chloroflexi bacterium]|nr:NADH-quinone oxidoreductase subunit L [Chloroflexota bacterium]